METTSPPPDVRFADIDDAVASMAPSERTDRLRQIELQIRALEAEAASLTDHNDRAGEYRRDGHRSMVGYLRAHLNCSNGRITRMRRCARLLRTHPAVGEALWSGRIGVDQAAELARALANPRCGHLLGESLPLLLGHAQRLKYDEFRLVVRRWEMLADLDGAEQDRGDAIRARRVMCAAGSDGIDLVATGGTPLQATQLQAILDAFTDAEYRIDRQRARDRLGDDIGDADLARTHPQRAFDALVKIFHTANNSSADDTPPAVTVNVVIDQHSFEDQLARHGLCPRPTDLVAPDPAEARSNTNTGTPIHPHDVIAAALLGHVRRVVIDSAGVVIDHGRRQRLFTGSAADAARLFATVCEHPGCTLPAAWSQLDHLTAWEHLGPTDQHNAGILCGHHNRHKHRTGLRARRDRHGRIQLQRPDGTWITPTGTDPPTETDFQTPRQRARQLAHNLQRRGFGTWTILTRTA